MNIRTVTISVRHYHITCTKLHEELVKELQRRVGLNHQWRLRPFEYLYIIKSNERKYLVHVYAEVEWIVFTLPWLFHPGRI